MTENTTETDYLASRVQVTDPPYDADSDPTERHHEVTEFQPPTDADLAEMLGEPAPPELGDGAVRRGVTDEPLSRFEVARFGQRPSWHEFAAPKAVENAWAAVQATLGQVEQAHDAEQSIGRDRQAEQRALEDAISAGKPLAPQIDWRAELQIRAATRRVRERELRQARGAYDQAVVKALPGWETALTKEATRARARAIDLVPAAAEAFSSWRGAVEALNGFVAAVDETRSRRLGVLDSDAARMRAAGRDGMTAALALVQSAHPVLTGTVWADDDGETVPDHVRRWAARDGSESAANWLASLEHAERYEVSRYAEALWRVVAPFCAGDRVLPAPWLPLREQRKAQRAEAEQITAAHLEGHAARRRGQ